MRISIIAAMSTSRVIGRGNRLPWKLPADLSRFKRLTMGHCLLVGRKTFESIGRPLPGRTVIVVTHQKEYGPSGVLVAHSVEEALKLSTGEEVFVAGGAELYRQTLSRANRLYLTLIEQQIEGDVYFPEFNLTDWHLVSDEHHEPTEGNAYSYSFLVYDRRVGVSVE